VIGQAVAVPEVEPDEIEAFLRVCAVPRRRAEPRVADALDGVARTDVASPHGTLAAWRVGEGPAVLLVHGWQDDHTLWSPLLDVLRGRGRAAVAFDLPAHGLSEGELCLGSEAADGIHAVAAALGPLDALVAHSFSANASLLALHERLDVARAVLIAPPLGTANRWLRWADRVGVSHEVALAAQARYQARIGRERAEFDTRAALAGVEVELLVVHSADDERMPVDDTRAVMAARPSHELHVVEGLSHRQTARDPAVVGRIADFVA
jgi:pimeloyl-ACP methyl ester carboxylesterase